MPLTSDGQNTAADAIGAAYTYAALFDDDPSGAGVEVGSQGNGAGSPAYARKQLDFSGGAAGGVDDAAASVTFDIPGGDTVHWVGLFTAVGGGTMGAYGQLPASEAYAAQGTYDLNAADITIT